MLGTLLLNRVPLFLGIPLMAVASRFFFLFSFLLLVIEYIGLGWEINCDKSWMISPNLIFPDIELTYY